jgi:hypothetical protein
LQPAAPDDAPPPTAVSRFNELPIPDQPITLSALLAVRQHCLRFAFAYSMDLETE